MQRVVKIEDSLTRRVAENRAIARRSVAAVLRKRQLIKPRPTITFAKEPFRCDASVLVREFFNDRHYAIVKRELRQQRAILPVDQPWMPTLEEIRLAEQQARKLMGL